MIPILIMEEFEYIEYGYEEDPDTIIDEEQTSIIDLIMYCMLPSVQQVLHYSGIFIFWNFIFRCLTQTGNNYSNQKKKKV